MGGGYKAAPQGMEAIAAKFADLQRQIDSLRGAAPIRNTAISAGGRMDVREGQVTITNAAGDVVIRLGKLSTGRYGLEVIDDDGDTLLTLGELTGSRHGLEVADDNGALQIRLGELQSGGYGLEQINGATAVPLLSLAYGAVSASVTGGISPNDTSGAWIAGSGGPSFSVTVGSSGRLLVSVGALIDSPSNSLGAISYTLTGPSTIAADNLHAGILSAVVGSVGSTGLRTGLTPGVYTCAAWYFVSSVPTSSTCQFSNRYLVAQPF